MLGDWMMEECWPGEPGDIGNCGVVEAEVRGIGGVLHEYWPGEPGDPGNCGVVEAEVRVPLGVVLPPVEVTASVEELCGLPAGGTTIGQAVGGAPGTPRAASCAI